MYSRTLAIKAVILATTICVASLPAYAQQSDLAETVVVTATGTPTDISKVGSSISVVTSKDIQQQQTVFATDILQTLPGVSVNQTGSRGNTSSVQLRGAPNYGTFVLIDGVEVSDPTQTQTSFDFSQLTATNIDRIEVLRGSQSVLYGGDAVGGVINITTARGQGDFTGLAYGEGGTYGTYTLGGHAKGGLDGDRFGYNVSAQYLGTDGFSAADSNLAGNTEAEKYHNISSSGRFDYALNDEIDLKAVYRYAGGLANYDACGGAFCDESHFGDYFKQYSGRLSSAFNFFDGFFSGEVGAAYARDSRKNFDAGSSDYFYDGDRTKFDFKGVLNFDPNDIVVFGAETKRDFSHSDADPVTRSVGNNGYYAEYQATPLEQLSLSAGVRLDDNERFGSFTTWRGTAAYNLDSTGTKLKASYATGFRAPSLFELYGICCGDPNLGNPNLQPEKSRSWDVGFEQNVISQTLHFGVTYFELDTDNAIEYSGVFGTLAPNYFNTPGTTTSRGIETEISWTPLDHLSLVMAYTYNDVKDMTGARVPQRPQNILNFNANYTFLEDRAGANLNVRYTSNTMSSDFDSFPSTTVNLGSYAVVNAGMSYKVFDQTELYGRVENLFGQKYETVYGYGTAGQSFFGGIRQSF